MNRFLCFLFGHRWWMGWEFPPTQPDGTGVFGGFVFQCTRCNRWRS